MKKLKIKDIITPSDIVNGDYALLSILQDKPIYPLVNDFINSQNALNLDIDYLLGFSNDKFLSPLAMKIYEQQNLSIDILFQKIAEIVYQRFGSKWNKLWVALNTEYNPLENYSMVEERTPNIKRIDEYDTIDEETNQNTNGIYGFNSIDSNPSSDNDGKGTNTKTGNVTKTETGNEEKTRSGNIGVTTSQQMLQSEFEVRKYDFYREIYKDIDSILCLKIY